MLPEGSSTCPSCGTSTHGSDAFLRFKESLADRYRIEQELGRGGMGVVYRATDLKHQRQVAIKVLRPELAALGPDRFLREIEIAARLNHPHILPLHDSGDAAGFLFYVMPLVEGESLRNRLNRESRLSLEDTVRITQNVAAALDCAHRFGVIHRDIKPENILLSGADAIVADFGIARAITEASGKHLTGAGLTIGTVPYMSPEQAAGLNELDGRSDVFSLACVAYEMLTGTPPFSRLGVEEGTAGTSGKPVARTGARRALPNRVARVIEKALAPLPTDRYATAADFAEALGQAHRESLRAFARWRPRWWWLGVVLGATLVATVIVIALLRRRPASPAGSPVRVAVLPFVYHGDEAFSHWSQGIVALLSSVLDGVGDLRTADPNAVLGVVQQEAVKPLDPERVREIASKLGVRRYVVGTIEESEGRVTISASAYDVTARPGEMVRATVEGEATRVLRQLVNDLAVQLLGAFGISESPRRLESISTGSVVALNEYLKGEAALRSGEFQVAATAFRRAVSADTLFALAWYRLAYALLINEGTEAADHPAQRALELNARLSEHDRRLAEAFLAFLRVETDRAERLYRGLVLDYPDDLEAQYLLSLLLLHFGPLRGTSMDSASAGLSRVLSLEPHHTQALLYLPWAAALIGDVATVDSALSRLLVIDPRSVLAPLYRAVRAMARGQFELAERMAAETSPGDDGKLYAVGMAGLLGNLPSAQRLAIRFFTGPERPPEVQAFGHVLAAHLDLARGRAQAASEQVRQAAALDPATGLEYGTLLALPPFLSTPAAELELLRSNLRRWNTATVPPSVTTSLVFGSHAGIHELLRLYLLGALSARLRDEPAALRYAADLEEGPSVVAGSPARTFARSVRAHVAFMTQRPAVAVKEFERAEWPTLTSRTRFSPFFSQAYERFLRAGALDALGRSEEALRWYASVWMQNAFDLVYLAPSYLRRAQIYERLGDRSKALQHYRQFAKLWREADPDLLLLVNQATKRIDLLTR